MATAVSIYRSASTGLHPATYRTRLSGSSDDLSVLIALAPELANTSYRNPLIDYACAGPELPSGLVATAHRTRKN
ncbi:hypothetical protein K1Y80_11085 [Streptomyces sp. MAG02]|nr:hypothetical protein [Streptomyces sp. MAG02]